MREDVRRDLTKSQADLERVILPALVRWCPEFGRSQLRAVETPDDGDELRRDLDTLAGIDAYQRWQSAMRGIAARVQIGRNYRTFTIRESRPSQAKTELEKRLGAIKHREEGYLYPHWTLQAYMSEVGGRLLSVGLAKTIELYPYIEACEAKGQRFPRKPASNGGEIFLYVTWDSYKRSGNYFFEYTPALVASQKVQQAIKRHTRTPMPEELLTLSQLTNLQQMSLEGIEDRRNA